MAFTDDLSDDFFAHTVALTKDLGIRPLDLLGVEAFESGVRASAMNPSSHAVGLIQFVPPTLKGMGWLAGPQAFASLDADAQLPYVHQFLAPYRGQLDSVGRVYQAVFLPASLKYAKDPGDVVAAAEGPQAAAYAANRQAFDTAGKGSITVGDLTSAAMRAEKNLGGRWTEIVERTRAAGGDISQDGGSMQTWAKLAIAGGVLVAAGAVAVGTYPSWKGALEGRENPARRRRTTVQTLIFKRDEGWTVPRAKSWARRHGYRSGKVDVTTGSIRLRQHRPELYRVMRTIPFGSGISAVVAR